MKQCVIKIGQLVLFGVCVCVYIKKTHFCIFDIHYVDKK